MGVIGYIVGKKVTKNTVIETISGNLKSKKQKKSYFNLSNSIGKTGTLFQMGVKYILRDVKTSAFVILTICLGVTLFTGLAYKIDTLKIYREDTKEMYYLNGQYAMTMQYFDNVNQGISRQSAKEIQEFNEIESIKTSSGIPIRVIDEDNVKRNDNYYDKLNENLKKIYGYSKVGNDGKNQIYKSMLCGYNLTALQSLKPYVIEGNFEPNNMKEDEVIICVLRMDTTKNNDIPSSLKEGIPLIQYKVCDEIPIKYRADLQTNSVEYENLSDHDAEYVYRKYKVAAIVSFQYMYECNRTVYPLLITGDQYIQEIAPQSAFQCVYLDGN